MSLEAMQDAGFFVDTMSIAIQATTAEGSDMLTTESAFVAGKPDRKSERQDAEMIANLGDTIGMDYHGKTAAQTIDMPVLIRKDLMPNGVVDVVSWLDAVAGGTFFGQNRPAEDYLEYLEKCRARERELQPTVDGIVAQLVSEALDIQTPVDAIRRLHKLSEAALLERALTDDKIDSMVFGEEAAFFLMGARLEMENGNIEDAYALLAQAESVARSNSCPLGADMLTSTDNPGNGEKGNDANCMFTSKQCPMCHRKNVITWDKQVSGNVRRISGVCGCSKVYVKKSEATSVRSRLLLVA
jgi:hypothetical protein